MEREIAFSDKEKKNLDYRSSGTISCSGAPGSLGRQYAGEKLGTQLPLGEATRRLRRT